MALGILLYVSLLTAGSLATPVQIHSSPITLPLALKINATGGAQALIERDRARYHALVAHGQAKANDKRADVPVPLTDLSTVYIANVRVGDGTYNLVVDTGSSNTWVGAHADKPYKPGPNSRDTGKNVSVSYGSGEFSGEEFIDDLTLGPVTIKDQSFGAASSSIGFDGFDGILGLGPTNLTRKTVDDVDTVPTVIDSLLSQGSIDTALFGISFVPTTSASNERNGQLDFGALDPRKFTSRISFFPIPKTGRASAFWGINQSVTYGNSKIPILSSTSGIVDTGTTLLLLATDAFQAYQKATGAKPDGQVGLLRVTNPKTLKSLFFHIGGTTFEFTANAQIWPRALNTAIGGQPGATYLIVASTGSPSGLGLDFINGFSFLQRFYSVYDTTNKRVGLATTSHTFDTSN